MGAPEPVARTERIGFTLGSRRIAGVERSLVPLVFSLEDALTGRIPDIGLPPDADGVRVLSAPITKIAQIRARWPDLVSGEEHRYPRHSIAMEGSFEDYLTRFSGKTRATLRKKRRRFEEADGGALGLSVHRTPDEIATFLDAALPLSRRTYQSRLLDAGLPADEAFRRHALQAAADNQVRAFLLRLGGAPVAYLYLPVVGDTLVYAHLGYAPDYAALSPGTVLQMAALEQLYAERRYRHFDFTEGDGAHKALFATHSVECASFLLLKPTLTNRVLLAALRGFDRAVAGVKAVAHRTGAEAALRRQLRQ